MGEAVPSNATVVLQLVLGNNNEANAPFIMKRLQVTSSGADKRLKAETGMRLTNFAHLHPSSRPFSQSHWGIHEPSEASLEGKSGLASGAFQFFCVLEHVG